VRIPRQVSGQDVARALRVLGYERVRQEGSHIRLTTQVNGTHHVTIPNHQPLKIGTLLGGVPLQVAVERALVDAFAFDCRDGAGAVPDGGHDAVEKRAAEFGGAATAVGLRDNFHARGGVSPGRNRAKAQTAERQTRAER